MSRPARILAIAGSDSSGGAGIQADVKTIAMLGGYAMTAITAVTAQNTRGVQAVEVLSPKMVEAQIDACLSDIGVDAVKIGMLGSPEIAGVVADRLERETVPLVFDPVMVATSGSVLASQETIAAFERLMDLAALTTPNVPELAALGGDAAMEARGIAYLAKGGDAEGATVEDRLVVPGAAPHLWHAERIETRHTHGTGCTLSSAIATFLGMGLSLTHAIEEARTFVQLALRDAPRLGEGNGPLGHHAVRMDLTGEPRLNQITVAAKDYAASVRFYVTLGLNQIVDSPANGYARFEAPGGVTLSIHVGDQPASAALYFETRRLDERRAELGRAGIAFEEPQEQSWNWREAWTRDPAGNRVCLYQAGIDRRYPPWRVSGGDSDK